MSVAAQQFFLNGKRLDPEAIQRGEFSKAGTAFEIATLGFCHQWLRGDETFTLTTSGSTGTPTMIKARRSAMEASARATIMALGLTKHDTALVCLNTNFIAGKMMLVRGFILGSNIIAVEPAADPFHDLSDEHSIGFTALVPYQLQAVLQSAASVQKLNFLKAVLIGGAPTDAKIRAEVNKLNAGVYATYGMTETLSHVALQKLNSPDAQDHFHAMPGVTLSKDERDCLIIHAPNLEIASLATNDIVELISSEDFRWLGRWDNVINSGGIKVIPEKVEKVVAEFFTQHQLTCRFFVAGLPDEALGSKVVLIVEGTLTDGKEHDLYEYMTANLSRFEAPKKILYVAQFAETETKKVNRSKTIINAEL